MTTRMPDATQIEVAITSLVVALGDEEVAEVSRRGGLPGTALAARRQVLDIATS